LWCKSAAKNYVYRDSSMKKSLLVFFFFLCACQPTVNIRGNSPLVEKLDSFVVGKTTAGEILEMCGSPFLQKDRFTWVYVFCKSEEIAFREDRSVEKLTVRITFDERGVLRSIDKIDQKNAKDRFIVPDREKTELITEKRAEKKIENIR
jgi:outer membrane protein assembly factor BamE (lipoprotein component of BamABCDE complex)